MTDASDTPVVNRVSSLDDAGSAVWQALAADPLVGVHVVTASGTLVFCNRRCVWLHHRDDRDPPIGRNVADIFPPEWAEERAAFIRQVVDTGRSLIVRHIRRGAELHTTLHLLDTPAGAEPRVLAITVEAGTAPHATGEEHIDVVESNVLDLGELDVLTRREIEVLALLGHGMSRGEIADALFRSPKTIDKHLESIATKLRVSSRLQLARIAHRAGLTLHDSDRVRTHDPMPASRSV